MPHPVRRWFAEGLRLLANRLDPPQLILWPDIKPLSSAERQRLEREWLKRYGG